MTATYITEESSLIHRETALLFAGHKMGAGATRNVYACHTSPDCVIKVESASQSFDNIHEWTVWNQVKDTKYAKWFAPCVSISPTGSVLLMKKTEQPRSNELPAKMPAFFWDFALWNFGWYDGRLVCHDYGSIQELLKHGLTSRMKPANWRTS